MFHILVIAAQPMSGKLRRYLLKRDWSVFVARRVLPVDAVIFSRFGNLLHYL